MPHPPVSEIATVKGSKCNVKIKINVYNNKRARHKLANARRDGGSVPRRPIKTLHYGLTLSAFKRNGSALISNCPGTFCAPPPRPTLKRSANVQPERKPERRVRRVKVPTRKARARSKCEQFAPPPRAGAIIAQVSSSKRHPTVYIKVILRYGPRVRHRSSRSTVFWFA